MRQVLLQLLDDGNDIDKVADSLVRFLLISAMAPLRFLSIDLQNGEVRRFAFPVILTSSAL